MRKNITVEFTNEHIIPSGELAVVGAILGKSDFVKNCSNMKVDCNHPQHQIKNGDVMLTYIGMQCMGKPSFDAVHEMDDDPDFYKAALGICYAIPSAETLRQRFDLIGSSIRRQILDENIKMLKSNGVVPSKLPCGYVPVDMDVSPFDNPKTCKEGVSRTYKGCDGYAPMFSYIGSERYLANLELRERKQHCQKGTPRSLDETINLCRRLTDEPLLFRLDSGNDPADNIGILIEYGCYFIIKRNLRKENKEDWLRMAKDNPLDITTPETARISISEAAGRRSHIRRRMEPRNMPRSGWAMKSLNAPLTKEGSFSFFRTLRPMYGEPYGFHRPGSHQALPCPRRERAVPQRTEDGHGS